MAEEVAGCKASTVCASMLFSNRRPLRGYWERKGCPVKESQFDEESGMRFLLLGRYLRKPAAYLVSKVIGPNFIFRRESLGIVNFFFCRM